MRVIIGEGSCGIAAGASKVRAAIESVMTANEPFSLGSTGCIGMCFLEPIVDLYEGDKLIKRLVKVTADDAQDIVDCARSGDLSLVEKLVISAEDEEFLTKQTRIALRHCGLIDPVSLDDYRAADGYQGLEKALKTMTPEQVIEEIRFRVLQAEAVQVSPPGSSGMPPVRAQAKKNILSVMLTRATPVRLWTEPLSSQILTALSKVCSSELMQSAQRK